MDDEERKHRRDERGPRMAIVRQAFLDEVEASKPRRCLRNVPEDVRAQYAVLLKSWLEGAVLGRRMQECKLRKFLAGGRLLNQAEVGSPNPERSPELEREVWSIDTLDDADLPIFGYVASISDVRDPEGGRDYTRRSLSTAYGPARLIYKPDLRSRSTITAGDSKRLLEQRYAAPSAFDAPSFLSIPHDAADYIDTRKHADECIATDFIECQTLGGVYIEDIERIIFDRRPKPETVKALAELDVPIPWRVADTPLAAGEGDDAPDACGAG